MGSFGRLVAGNRMFYTVERQWLGNKPFKSCVPLGEYDLVWLPTTTPVPDEYEGHTWYLSGETVSADYSSEKPRTRIAFHIANLGNEVEGCIGTGRHLTTLSGSWAVGRSRAAMVDLLAVLPREGGKMKIVPGKLG